MAEYESGGLEDGKCGLEDGKCGLEYGKSGLEGGKSYTARLNAFYWKIKASSLLHIYIPPCKIV